MSAVTSRPILYALAAALLASAVARAAPDQKPDRAPEAKPKDAKPPAGLEIAALDARAAVDAAAGAGTPVMGPSAPNARPPAKAAGPHSHIALIGGAAGPDDLALRYYASLKQTGRVNAELARLHTLYPAYEPPANLYEAPAANVIDEQPFWVLFAADRLDELKAAIAAKQRELPGWKPSADLAAKIRRKEMRLKISSLSRDGKVFDLVDYMKGKDVSDLFEEVDLLWTIAEAYARAKQSDDAVRMFGRVLANAKDAHIRVATVQKALGALRMADVEKLLAGVPGAAEGRNEFAEVAIDLTRARIAAFLHDERAEPVPAEELRNFEAYAREARDARQLGLVAWYGYKRRDFAGALEWFKLAIQNDGDAMVAHGLAHSLRALGMKREAEEVAYAWREPLANNVILFLDLLETELTREVPPYIEPHRLARYATATMEAASGEGAQALAWYAYNSCQWDAALFWFERAVAWFPKDATVYGYALTLRRLKKEKGLYELANRYDGLFVKVLELIFPDNYYHPPTPCDQRGAERLHGAGLRTPAFIVPGPALIPGAAPAYAAQEAGTLASRATSYPLVLQPAQAEARAQAMLKALRGRFPAAVAMENPLRFRALPMPSLLAMRAPATGLPVAPPTPLRREPATIPAPLVARRTPGVGPMPYEQYGFSLLPGWNGQEQASWPPYSQQIAPPGTQWDEQEADPARGAMTGFARNAGPAAPLGPSAAAGPRPVAAYGQQPPAQPFPMPGQGYPPAPAPGAPAYVQYLHPAFRNQ